MTLLNMLNRNKSNLKLVPQNAAGLKGMIRTFGCNFRCHLAMAEIVENKALTVEQINEAYDYLITLDNVMKPDCTLLPGLSRIINHGFRLLGVNNKYGMQIGTYTEKYNFWMLGKGAVDFTVLFGTTESGNPHYRLGKGLTKKVFLDPYEPSPKIVTEHYRMFYAITKQE
jgi:hypothetical protein